MKDKKAKWTNEDLAAVLARRIDQAPVHAKGDFSDEMIFEIASWLIESGHVTDETLFGVAAAAPRKKPKPAVVVGEPLT